MSDDELMSTQGDTPCQSCGRRRPLVGITFPDSTSFQVCTHCAVVGIRTNGVSTAELHFPVGPDDGNEPCGVCDGRGCDDPEGCP